MIGDGVIKRFCSSGYDKERVKDLLSRMYTGELRPSKVAHISGASPTCARKAMKCNSMTRLLDRVDELYVKLKDSSVRNIPLPEVDTSIPDTYYRRVVYAENISTGEIDILAVNDIAEPTEKDEVLRIEDLY